jgi:4-alpha-glucanotransferase
MRHAGIIRNDHILGLMRSFWIPDGASSGTYINYPFDALLAAVAIESARSDGIVIGEDLGLVPDGLREKLAASGIYSLDVMQSMRSHDGEFTDMQHARPKVNSAFAPHDTPTIACFFSAEAAKYCLKLGTHADTAWADIFRDRDHTRTTRGGAEPVEVIHGRLTAAQSEFVAVQMDDIAHLQTQQNVPGTVDEYPNRRQKSPFALSDVAASAEFTKLSDAMHSHGLANPRLNGDGSCRS